VGLVVLTEDVFAARTTSHTHCFAMGPFLYPASGGERDKS